MANASFRSLLDLKTRASYFSDAIIQSVKTGRIEPRSVLNAIDAIDIPISSRLITLQAVDSSGKTLDPVVTLPVNPKVFKVAYKKHSSYKYTLGGFVLNHWHPDVITITCTGFIPSMRGKSKVMAQSYQAFLQLLEIFKSCGDITGTSTNIELLSSGEQANVAPPIPPDSGTGINVPLTQPSYNASSMVATSNVQASAQSQQGDPSGSTKIADPANTTAIAVPKIHVVTSTYQLQNAEIKLIYQADCYTGIFTDFSIEEDEEQPNTISYSFVFIARKWDNVVTGSLLSTTALNLTSFATGTVNTLTKEITSPINFISKKG